ncbi:unnamed protein product, partial [Tetraodon nigroviridis]
EDSSVMARMQKKFWKTKQVFIKATGKKEDEYVVASDADLDAKLEFFRSVQSTCTDLLKAIEKYQQRIIRLSQEENELGLFLRFQAEHDRSKAGNMMDATSKALCTSAKQRRRECVLNIFSSADGSLHTAAPLAPGGGDVPNAGHSGHAPDRRPDGEGSHRVPRSWLWMKDVQAQVRGTKGQFEKLKNDVCQKVDMLGASRCNMLSHSLCTYQTTLLHFWEKTAHAMSGIQTAFQGHVQYQFTTLKVGKSTGEAKEDLRDPLEELADLKDDEKKEKSPSNTDSLVSLDDDRAPRAGPSLGTAGQNESRGGPSLLTGTTLQMEEEEEEDVERGDMAFLKDLLSPGPGASDEFSREWQDAFGVFEPANTPQPADETVTSGAPANPPSSSPTGFLPSQLLDHSLSSTGLKLISGVFFLLFSGWSTPPMFQAVPLQIPPAPPVGSKDMSAWFNLFADLDPLSNPDAIGRSADELLNA